MNKQILFTFFPKNLPTTILNSEKIHDSKALQKFCLQNITTYVCVSICPSHFDQVL